MRKRLKKKRMQWAKAKFNKLIAELNSLAGGDVWVGYMDIRDKGPSCIDLK